MTGSPHYDVSRWLCKVLKPVRSKYNKHCVKDTFEFIDLLKQNKVSSKGFMCSFDIVSFFTKGPVTLS